VGQAELLRRADVGCVSCSRLRCLSPNLEGLRGRVVTHRLQVGNGA
jgi:hypothetical protein